MQEETDIRQIQKEMVAQGKRYFSKIGLLYLAGSVLIMAVQWLVLELVSRVWPEWLQSSTSLMLVLMLPMYTLAMPLMIFLITRVRPVGTAAEHKMSAGKIAVAFIMCFSIMYLGNLAGTISTTVIGYLKGSGVGNALNTIVMGNSWWVIFIFMVICAPVFEEFIFRKLLVDRAAQYGESVAVVLSGLLFGLFHGNLNQFVYAFFLGIFLAFIYVRTRKIRYTVILHMLLNFFGSVVSVWVLNAAGYDKLMEAMQLLQSNQAAGMAALRAALPGMMILGGYVLLMFGLTITGVVLLIANRKKFRLLPGNITLPAGKRFSAAVLNLGMLLFCGFWLFQIICQLILPA